MQAVVALPEIRDPRAQEKTLFRKIAGIPLLQRVLGTAARSGVERVEILVPQAIDETWLRKRLDAAFLSPLEVHIVTLDRAYDPDDPGCRGRVKERLDARFLWLPWNWVTTRAGLRAAIDAAENAPEIGEYAPAAVDASPRVVSPGYLGAGAGPRGRGEAPGEEPSPHNPAGIRVHSSGTAREAERLLIRGAGKPGDGFYSRFNRRLCRPFTRWLAKTPVTANMVTLAGIPLAAFAGYLYTLGHWGAYAAGGLVYFLSVELDEVDGMIARTKFEDSPFGVWLETAADYSSILFLWSGMSVGLYREYGSDGWLWAGAGTIAANVLTFIMLARQRRTFVPHDHPEQYQKRSYGVLEADSSSVFSRAARKIAFFAKRGVMCHYILLFSVLDLLPVLFFLVALGSAITILVVVHMQRLFRTPVLTSR